MYDVADQIKHYNRIGDLGKSWNLEELKTQQVASGQLGMVAFSMYYWVFGELEFVLDRRQKKGIHSSGGSWFFCDGPLRPCLRSWVFSLIVVPVNNICWFLSDSLPWQLGCIAPHHIDILGYNPQWNVLPPNIPHIVPRHHRECRLGSFLIPCWSF